VLIPYGVAGEFICGLAFGLNEDRFEWPEYLLKRARLLSEIVFNALGRKKADLEIQGAFKEIQILKERLEQDNTYMRQEIDSIHKHSEIVGESDAILRALKKVEQVAKTDATALILGETGTGKELIARAIHNSSSRKDRPMVAVNCAALPGSLIESELFGREKGAFTSADTKQMGRFEIADGSTLFLDEVGELPPEMQVKLLRVLQEGQFERLGSSKTISVNVRVIAATNRNLIEAVQKGAFRDDLYYRLNVFPIQIPPLRERPEDVLPLTWSFVEKFAETMGKRITQISRRSAEAMQSYPWPGNVRELRNVVEHAMIISTGENLVVEIPEVSQSQPTGFVTLEECERRYIQQVLEKTRGRIRGDYGAAEILGLKPSTLYSRMKKLGIDYSRKQEAGSSRR
jgi:transcriptional regulator with GAF, ATPase, and Fis domain